MNTQTQVKIPHSGPVSYSDWQLKYSRDFVIGDALTGLKLAHLWGDKIINLEEQQYTKDGVTIELAPDGSHCLTMTLTKTPENTEGWRKSKGQPYLSGIATSYDSFSIGPWFRMEADLMLPKGMGLWAAFWVLAIEAKGKWPKGQAMAHEIDGVEKLGREGGNWYHVAHHYMPAGGSELEKHWSLPVNTKDLDLHKGFNKFGIEVMPSGVYCYLNNDFVAKMPAPEEYKDLEWHWLANLACGGAWAESINNDTPLPAKLYVKEVRAYLPDSIIDDRPPVNAIDGANNNITAESEPDTKPDCQHSGANAEDPEHEFSVETVNQPPPIESAEGEREYTYDRETKNLRWTVLPNEFKWNVYLDNNYIATVHNPEFKVEHAGRYGAGGIVMVESEKINKVSGSIKVS